MKRTIGFTPEEGKQYKHVNYKGGVIHSSSHDPSQTYLIPIDGGGKHIMHRIVRCVNESYNISNVINHYEGVEFKVVKAIALGQKTYLRYCAYRSKLAGSDGIIMYENYIDGSIVVPIVHLATSEVAQPVFQFMYDNFKL